MKVTDFQVYVNLCWAIGQFIAAGVLQGCLELTNHWGYRIPFAVQVSFDTSRQQVY